MEASSSVKVAVLRPEPTITVTHSSGFTLFTIEEAKHLRDGLDTALAEFETTPALVGVYQTGLNISGEVRKSWGDTIAVARFRLAQPNRVGAPVLLDTDLAKIERALRSRLSDI